MAITYLDNQPGKPSGSKITYLDPPDNRRLDQKMAEPISKALEFINNPGGTQNAEAMGPQGDELFDRAGTALTETLGKRFDTPYLNAAAGTAVSMANPENWITPEIKPGAIMRPKVPSARQAAVSAADELKIPLSRAEQTGGPVTSATESLLEKTPLGRGPIDAFRKEQMAAKEAALRRTSDEMGTSASKFDVGQKAKSEIPNRQHAMNDKRQIMFDAIPENTHIPIDNAVSTADQILVEQSKYLPTTRNSDVMAIAQDIQKASKGISSGEGVTGGPDKFGETISVSPETPQPRKSNFQLLKRLRETLGGKIAEAKAAKNFSAARDYTRLKVGVDADIDAFVSGQSKPMESMMADEFKQTYKKANAFSGAYKNLYEGDLATTLADTPPEHVVDTVFKKNNETAIKQFRAIVGEEGFKPAKARVTQTILESPSIKTALKKFDNGTLDAIYTPVELAKLRKLGDVMDLIQSAEKTSGNASGTARQLIGKGSWTAAGLAALHGNFAAAAAIIGIPYVSSKILVGTAKGIPISGAIKKAGVALKAGAGNR